MPETRASYGRVLRFTWISLLVVIPLALLAAGIAVTVHLANLFADAIEADVEDGNAAWFFVGTFWVLGLVVSVIGVLWCVGTIFNGCLVRTRAAYQCCFCWYGADDVVIRNLRDLKEWHTRFRQEGARDEEAQFFRPSERRFATPIGHGWSFWLNKTTARSPRLFLHGLRGRVPKRDAPPVGDHWYYTGTTVGEVMSSLKTIPSSESNYGHTLASTPSHSTISLGGWVAARAHGTGGTLWSKTIAYGWLFDQESGEFGVWDYDTIKAFFGRCGVGSFDARQYILIAVCVIPIPNHWVRLEVKKKMPEKTDTSSSWWLAEPSRLRCIFVGRRGSLLMLWKPSAYSDETKHHIDPHFCSRECRYFQADLLSSVQSARHQTRKWFAKPVEESKGWDGLTLLSNANEFSPLISALAMAIGTFYHNIEFFLKVSDMTSARLDKLQDKLIDYHTKHGGRTELRFGVFDDGNADYLSRGKVFVDFSLTNLRAGLGGACAILQEVFGTTVQPLPKVTMHPGKTVIRDKETLLRYVSPYVLIVCDANL